MLPFLIFTIKNVHKNFFLFICVIFRIRSLAVTCMIILFLWQEWNCTLLSVTVVITCKTWFMACLLFGFVVVVVVFCTILNVAIDVADSVFCRHVVCLRIERLWGWISNGCEIKLGSREWSLPPIPPTPMPPPHPTPPATPHPSICLWWAKLLSSPVT